MLEQAQQAARTPGADPFGPLRQLGFRFFTRSSGGQTCIQVRDVAPSLETVGTLVCAPGPALSLSQVLQAARAGPTPEPLPQIASRVGTTSVAAARAAEKRELRKMSLQIEQATLQDRFGQNGARRVRPGGGTPGLALQGVQATAVPGAQPFIGGLIKRIGRIGGRIIGGALGLPQQPPTPPGFPSGPIALPQQPVPQARRCPPGTTRVGNKCLDLQDILPGGEPFATPAGPAPGMQIACPSGFHPNKSEYFLKDGTFVPKGSRCVKNRRRNPLNPRALDRAISRIQSAKKASKKISRVTVRKKKC